MIAAGPRGGAAARAAIVLAGVIVAAACHERLALPPAHLEGTWGGDNAGMIVSGADIHVHIGCTLGNARGPIQTDAEGRFEIEGQYNVDAFPVDRGILHPAVFRGRVTGRTMTLTVTLTDTTRQLGPVSLLYGKEPRMGPCPICRP